MGWELFSVHSKVCMWIIWQQGLQCPFFASHQGLSSRARGLVPEAAADAALLKGEPHAGIQAAGE